VSLIETRAIEIIDALTKSANEMKSTFQTLVSGLRKMIRRFPGSPAEERSSRKLPYIASFDEVTVARDADCARIEYNEAGIPVTHLSIGPGIAKMSDREIIKLHNDCLRNHAKQSAEIGRVALEVPLGLAQIKYFARSHQWVPRGRVLRCLIRNEENDQLVIKIDEQELRLRCNILRSSTSHVQPGEAYCLPWYVSTALPHFSPLVTMALVIFRSQ
jgi:hypothetical protein